MIEILKVVCICFGVLNFQGFNSNEFPAVSGNRKSTVRNGINNTYNYPNPFRSSTTIIYNIINPGNVTIYIFDLLGREIGFYDEGFRYVGEFERMINLGYLNSGVYFYEIKVDGRRLAINRLILLK
jgi:hypothetical protein